MGTYFGSCDHRMNKLREAEILLNQGTTLPVAWKKIGEISFKIGGGVGRTGLEPVTP